jgi:hypothetical protein
MTPGKPGVFICQEGNKYKMASVEEMPVNSEPTPEEELDMLVSGELPRAAGSLALNGYQDFFFDVLEPMPFGD